MIFLEIRVILSKILLSNNMVISNIFENISDILKFTSNTLENMGDTFWNKVIPLKM